MMKFMGFVRGYEERSVSIEKSSNREFYVAMQSICCCYCFRFVADVSRGLRLAINCAVDKNTNVYSFINQDLVFSAINLVHTYLFV